MKKWLNRRNIVILIALLAVVGVGWRITHPSKKGEVKTVMVERKDVVQTLALSGKIKAEREAVLRFPSAGKLGYVKALEGDSVKKGQVLAAMDLGDLQAAQTAAYYSYIAADANAKEIEDQVKGHDKDETFAQKNDRVAAQTARDKAYDAWQTAQRAVRNAVLVSPIEGVVVSVSVSVSGETVGITDGVDVVDPASLYFEAEVDEADLGKIAEGMVAKTKLDAFADELVGIIERIGFESKQSDSGATVYGVRIKVTSDKTLRVGMNGDTTLITGEAKNVLALPIEAVVDGKVENGKGEKISVETGLVGDTDLEIKSGVKEGEWIRLSL